MKTVQGNHRRRSIRLWEYDYTQMGAYFITVVTHDRAALFGEVVEGGATRLSKFGEIVASAWVDLSRHYPNVQCDQFVVMPNHIHSIIVLGEPIVEAGLKPASTHRHGLPEIVRALKTFSARRINEICHTPGAPVWQRNYYEHIIRGDEELLRVRECIVNNPLEWEHDRENPRRDVELKPARATGTRQV